MADAEGLNPSGGKPPCGFESRPGHVEKALSDFLTDQRSRTLLLTQLIYVTIVRFLTDIGYRRSEARAITGNRVEVLEVSHHEVRARLDGNATLWRDIVRDGVTVYGLTIDELVEPVHA